MKKKLKKKMFVKKYSNIFEKEKFERLVDPSWNRLVSTAHQKKPGFSCLHAQVYNINFFFQKGQIYMKIRNWLNRKKNLIFIFIRNRIVLVPNLPGSNCPGPNCPVPNCPDPDCCTVYECKIRYCSGFTVWLLYSL